MQELTAYKGEAPSHSSETSMAAAARQTKEKREINKDKWLAVIDLLGGATCDQVEEYTGMSHQTASALMSTMTKLPSPIIKRAVPVQKRLTRNGSYAYVMVRA